MTPLATVQGKFAHREPRYVRPCEPPAALRLKAVPFHGGAPGFKRSGVMPDYALKSHGGLIGTKIYGKRLGEEAYDIISVTAAAETSRTPKIKSAARSPIIALGAWVLPEINVGMIEASATRR